MKNQGKTWSNYIVWKKYLLRINMQDFRLDNLKISKKSRGLPGPHLHHVVSIYVLWIECPGGNPVSNTF